MHHTDRAEATALEPQCVYVKETDQSVSAGLLAPKGGNAGTSRPRPTRRAARLIRLKYKTLCEVIPPHTQ